MKIIPVLVVAGVKVDIETDDEDTPLNLALLQRHMQWRNYCRYMQLHKLISSNKTVRDILQTKKEL